MRPFPSRDWRAARRARALQLIERGMTQAEAARTVGVTQGAVAHWVKAVREGGPVSLRSKPRRGRQPRVPRARIAEVVIPKLREGALANGFADGRWTWARVAEVIERELGVRYHYSQVQRIVTRLGWSIRRGGRRRARRDMQAHMRLRKRRDSMEQRAR